MKYSVNIIKEIELRGNGAADIVLLPDGLAAASIALGAIYDGRLNKLTFLSESGHCRIVFEPKGYMYILLDGICRDYKLSASSAEALYRIMTDHALSLTFPDAHLDIEAQTEDGTRCDITFRVSYPAST